jgi:hypothetical protein
VPEQSLDRPTIVPSRAGDRRRREARDVPRLRCAACGLRYGGGAFARQPALLATVTCRRCGGALEPDGVRPATRRDGLRPG